MTFPEESIPFDPLVGQLIDGRYRIVSLIARGGIAKVYKAEQIHLNRTVAIKVLDPKHVGADDPEFQKRFELEAQMTSKLNHPNTVTIHDYGFNPEKHFYYFVMEFIQGKTLRRAMQEDGVFAVERALHIARQIAKSVRQAHSVGIVHRDLKPSNVLLTTHDQDTNYVKVVDFGLLKLKKEALFDGEKTDATLMGSPRYMSPEQIRRSRVDHRTDIYSLGVNLYQMLTGKPPFSGSSAVQIMMGHLNHPPPPFKKRNPSSNVPVEVETFVLKCLKKDPAERPQDMDEVIGNIEELFKLEEKAGSYISLTTARVPKVVAKGSGEGWLQEGKMVEEGVAFQPAGPPAWSDTLTESPFYEPQAADGLHIPIDVGESKVRRKSPALVVAVVLVGIIFVGVMVLGGVLLFGPKQPDRAGEGIESQHGKTLVDRQTSTEKAGAEHDAKIGVFKLKFETTPKGAHIFENQDLLCTTPCEVDWVVTAGQTNATRTFSLIKEGFEPMKIMQPTPQSDVTISIPLMPIETEEETGEEKKEKPFLKSKKDKPTAKPQVKESKEEGKGKDKDKEKGGLKLIHDYPDL